MNQTFLTWTGYARDEVLGRRFADLLDAGGRIYHETHFAPLLSMQGSVRAIALNVRRADGSLLPVLVNARQYADSAGRPLANRVTVFDATDRKRYEAELLEARRRAEQAVDRMRLVEGIVADLAAVAWVDDVTRVVCDAGGRAFGAGASGVWLLDGATGRLRGSASSSAPSPLSDSPATARPSTLPDIPLSAPAAQDGDLRRGQVVVRSATEAATAFPIVADSLGREAEGMLALVPLSVGERTIGILALRFADHRDLEPAELTLLQTLGRQAGQALERAQLSEQQRNVATTLQRNLLPRELPADPRLLVATVYRPAFDTLEVGGDWYDAFRLDADRVALVVGDVVGRGLDAAAAMGQLRSAIRALAAVDSGPALLLQRLDSFADGFHAAQTATLAYAEVDLRDGSVRYACAGHPPPVHVDRTGVARLLWDGRSAPVGAQLGGAPRAEATSRLGPGERLVLYTDGLVERRDRPIDECIDRLVDELPRWSASSVTDLADGVVDVLLRDETSRDDVCLLAVERLE